MGGVQPKCCAAQDVQNTTGEAASETKLVSDQPIPPVGKPLWLTEAEEYVTLQKQKEEENHQRIEQLAAQRAEEERKAQEEERKAEEEAKAKTKDADKKKTQQQQQKKAAAPKPSKPEEEAKGKVPEEVEKSEKVKTADTESGPSQVQQKIDDAVKQAKEAGDAKFEFEVKCVSARGLRDADWLEGTSDPYCLCEAVGKVKCKFKTKTVNNKENPVWNQAAKMQLCHGDKLKFSIFDQDTGKPDDFLGYAELDFNKICPSGFEGELPLKDASDTAAKQEAYIKVRVRSLGAVAPK
ncbi:unnamed protein product [Durusdinium trenchii]|uniref:C2 domain-containing protein n=1 Tax=Durusdinium trenchii TaxID=1381693 RepID=A0ABP0JQG1_9DINO